MRGGAAERGGRRRVTRWAPCVREGELAHVDFARLVVAKYVVVLYDFDANYFERVLDKPPHNAVDPDPQSEQVRLVQSQAQRLDVVGAAVRPRHRQYGACAECHKNTLFEARHALHDSANRPAPLRVGQKRKVTGEGMVKSTGVHNTAAVRTRVSVVVAHTRIGAGGVVQNGSGPARAENRVRKSDTATFRKMVVVICP